jgi:hypothetical protein
MLKYIEAGSWDGFNQFPIATEVPISSSGFTLADRSIFMSKTAATERFVYDIANIKTGSGDILIHVNAMGATEAYGPNRRGDGFRAETLRRNHPSFVKHAHIFTQHKNKEPEINFGKIASSCYNEDMCRVELLLQANGTTEAARRNGGLVLPPSWLEKLEKNAEIPVSMGCLVPYDVCSICGNEAANAKNYCDETNCRDPKTGEYWPGCKHGLMKVGSDGRIQYVDNIDPHFFDLSLVRFPADRCGYGFRADYLENDQNLQEKTASVRLSSDQLLYYPVRGLPKLGSADALRTEIARLAKKEYDLYENADARKTSLALGMCGFDQDTTLGRKIASMLPETRYDGLRYCAERGIFLSPENFITVFGLPKEAGCAIREHSQNIYRNLYSAGSTAIDLASIMSAFDNAARSKTAEWLMPDEWLQCRECTQEIVSQSALRGLQKLGALQKTASADSNPYLAEQWAEHIKAYALYKAASLCFFPKTKKDFGENFAVGHLFAGNLF